MVDKESGLTGWIKKAETVDVEFVVEVKRIRSVA